jgi:hypothetical protein
MTLQEQQAHNATKGYSREAEWRLCQRYGFDGPYPQRKEVLQKALRLVREGKARRVTEVRERNDCQIWDVPYEADQWSPKPLTIRVVVNSAQITIITVLAHSQAPAKPVIENQHILNP